MNQDHLLIVCKYTVIKSPHEGLDSWGPVLSDPTYEDSAEVQLQKEVRPCSSVNVPEQVGPWYLVVIM